VRNYSSDDSGREAIDWLRGTVERGASDSAWLREEYRRHGTLSDVVRRQCELWSVSLGDA
jgi:gamma-glutamyl:cysteine ligase YbdK (ATP-grasp superfamily)